MRCSRKEAKYIGRTALEIVYSGAAALMRDGKTCSKAFVGPSTFQLVHDQLVFSRDPTLRAEWDGNRCYLRVAVCGRELSIHMDPSLEEGDVEFSMRSDK